MLTGHLARALSGEDAAFIGGRSNTKSAIRDKSLLLEIALFAKVAKPYIASAVGSGSNPRDQSTVKIQCEGFAEDSAEFDANTAIQETGADDDVASGISDAANPTNTANDSAENNPTPVRQSGQDDAALASRDGRDLSCNYFGINCFEGLDHQDKTRVLCGNCWADHDEIHPAIKGIMERAESASEDNLSTATLNEARAELIVILKALGSPTNSSSVEKYFRRGPKPRGDSRTADSLKDKFGELKMPMDKNTLREFCDHVLLENALQTHTTDPRYNCTDTSLISRASAVRDQIFCQRDPMLPEVVRS